MGKLTKAETDLLHELCACADRGAFAMAVPYRYKPAAHALERAKLAEWKGESYGSSFWAATEAGRAALTPSDGPSREGEDGR